MTLYQILISKFQFNLLTPYLPTKRQATLIIGDDGFDLIAFCRGSGLHTQFVSRSDDLTATIVEKLKLWQIESLRLVTNQIGQSYARESIPPAGKRDREGIIQRRIATRFGTNALTTYLPLKPSEHQELGELPYLLATVGEDSEIHRLVRELDERNISISSLALLPLEWANLLPELLPRATGIQTQDQWQVVVTRHRSGGIRHVVLHNGQMILTRLTAEIDPTDTKSDDHHTRTVSASARASHIFQEIRASIGYIKRFGYTPEQPLFVYLVGDNDFEQVSKFGKAGSEGQWEVLRPSSLSGHAGLDLGESASDEFADNLLGALFCTKSSRHPLQSPQLTVFQNRKKQERIAGRTLHIATLGLAVVLAMIGFETIRSLNTMKQSEQRFVEVKNRSEQIFKQSQKLPYKSDQIRQFLGLYLTHFEDNETFPDIYWTASNTIPTNVRLTSYNWQIEGEESRNVDMNLDLTAFPDKDTAFFTAKRWIELIRLNLPEYDIDTTAIDVSIGKKSQDSGSWNENIVVNTEDSKLHGKLKFTISRK